MLRAMTEPRSRWSMITAFALLAALTQVLWVTYAPVADATTRYYGVGDSAVGWLANVYPLVYVLLAIPAGVLLDRWFRGGLALGAVLVALGAVIRITGDSYTTALAGQLVVSVAQPLVLNAITGVAGRYLADRDRPAGIAVGSASTFAGLIVGFGLGAVFSSDLPTLLLVQAALAVIAALAVLAALRRPAEHSVEASPAGFGALRVAWKDRSIRTLCALVFVPFGVFVTMATFAQPLLEPAGVSETTAGLILISCVVAGVAGCAVVPIWANRHGREVSAMTTSLLVTVIACVTLAVAPGVVTGFATLTLIGFALLPALPIVLELTERRGSGTEGTAAGLIWLAGNLGGLVLAAVVGVLVDEPTTAFLLLGVLSLLTLPLLRAFGRSGAGHGIEDGSGERHGPTPSHESLE
jgi:predicted MFS family arabinose efflux permease